MPARVSMGARTPHATIEPASRLRPLRAPTSMPTQASIGLRATPSVSDSADAPAIANGKKKEPGKSEGRPSRNQVTLMAPIAPDKRAHVRARASRDDARQGRGGRSRGRQP